ncbi:MAG: hypothetical protein AB1521_08385 [Bacteroidota bacterium]
MLKGKKSLVFFLASFLIMIFILLVMKLVLIYNLIVIICYVLISMYVYLYILWKKDKEKFENLNTIIQTTGLFLTIIIALFAIALSVENVISAEKSTDILNSSLTNIYNSSENVKNVLNEVGDSLSIVPIKLHTFSTSIEKLNAIIDKQQSQFLSHISIFENKIGQFDTSLSEYKNAIDDYSIQLKTIVKETEEQLNILNEQQKNIKRELEKKPRLVLSLEDCAASDSGITFNRISFKNEGDIEAYIKVVYLTVLKRLNPIVNFPHSKVIYEDNIAAIYQLQINQNNYGELVIIDNTPGSNIECKVLYKIPATYEAIVSIRVDYLSRYKNGKEQKTFYLCSKKNN